MKYDFTSIIDRHGKDAIAVEFPPNGNLTKEGFDQIPMWVADMNFATVPTIPEEMIKRAQHPCFGYFRPSDEYYQAIIDWHKDRNGVEGLKADNIGYENGVLGGVATALKVFCSRGDKILLHSPTYVGFRGVLENNGYDMVLSPLHRDENGVWRMDFDDMEKKLAEQNIHAAIFCSPYNPVGRVWEKWEIEKAMELYEKYQVFVISDEIWSDLIIGDHKHIPTQSINEYAKMHTVAMYAPSKTFNLAGLIGSYHIVYNKWINDRMKKESSLGHYNSMNVMSMHALIGGYSAEGRVWLDELREVLAGNVDFAYDHILKNYPGVTLAKPEGTYMLFLNCEQWCKDHNITIDELQKKGASVGVMWQDGRRFFEPYGIRMNLALPFSRVKEAFDRLDKYVFTD
ncbi:MAG: aminotransferase class I/II-fold pyridoxal phosphate-dependent enzyme [Erysipelotrichaceae bacterium]|nr:aminotransferase class I/II-fold pyridoxal phosphate-dependent enzyme [Erysipelotrichaceae bacterium]